MVLSLQFCKAKLAFSLPVSLSREETEKVGTAFLFSSPCQICLAPNVHSCSCACIHQAWPEQVDAHAMRNWSL